MRRLPIHAMHLHRFTLPILLSLLAGTVAATAQVTIHNSGFNGDNMPLPTDYGSRASADDVNWTVVNGGAPNLVLGWQVDGQLDTYTGWPGAGDGKVIQIAPIGSPVWSVSFTPDAGYGAQLLGFELIGWPHPSIPFEMDWTVTGSFGGGPIASGTWALDNNGGLSAIDFGAGLTGDAGEALTLQFELISGAPDYIAIDNLRFAQYSAIPEPSTYAALAGLGALGLATWRRQRARASEIRLA